jgi:2-aminoadipate transaminase
MIDALATHMPEGVTWTTPEGGFFIWVTLPDSIDTEDLATQAKERGVVILPGAQCFVSDQGKNTMRLSYSYAQDDQIAAGIQILAEVVKGELLEAGGS